MMTMILKDIKEYTQIWKNEIAEQVKAFGETQPPQLAIVQVGAVEASNRYIRNKVKDCKEVGIKAHHYAYGEGISTEELVLEVEDLQNHYDGIIVQLPLPEHINVNVITKAIRPEKDVDGFRMDSWFTPCTPGGIVKYLKYCGWEAAGKDVVVIGRSDIVGKPMARLLTDMDATVTLCHSKTVDLSFYVLNTDLVICAVGKPKFLNCYPISCPVIDVGINFDSDGKLVGDCYNTENRDVTPVPGGVGLLTRCMLLENVLYAAKAR